MAYNQILKGLAQGARNIGQAGKMGMQKSSQWLRNNPEDALIGGALGAMGGAMAYNFNDMAEDRKIRQYQELRKFIKQETDGLGGLVYNKKKDQYVVTYAGSPTELKENKHFYPLKLIIDETNDRLDIKMKTSIHALSPKQSEKQQKQIEKMLSTPEGAEELEKYLMESERHMRNPYGEDYARMNENNPFLRDLPQGDTMGSGDFR
tara:strand:+ start:48 stop:665 length:618 start_codon:yes stop_codon:yes gene_type:complete